MSRAPGCREVLCLAGGLMVLSGCVYLRLLTVKRQLTDFESNFSLGGRSELEIEFKTPVLLAKDVRFLIGADPSLVTPGDITRHHYEFDLVPDAGADSRPPLARLTLDLTFSHNKLRSIIVPEKFMLLFPRHVLVDTLKQAKDAQIFESRRLARGRIQLSSPVEAELPSRTMALFLLGSSPLDGPEGDAAFTITRRYRIVTETRPVPITARLTFRPDGLLDRVHVRWDKSAVEALFDRAETPSPSDPAIP